MPTDDFISYMPKAIEISLDPHNIQYFALALKAGAILWSNEKRLKNQDKITVLSTSDLIELLKKEE
ncbi:MAG TPA: hypothetical protein VKK79_18455 [Candidatus Lokiarchaeia archaeon]|nr:hypothetical protein [Candidatus Lokiarchaeia archaeon]